MDVQKFVFRKPAKVRNDVFIVREGNRFGLILVPNRGDNMPDSLSADALQALSGAFVTPPQWDEIRANVCFNPEDDSADDLPEPGRLTCNYYVLRDGRWGILDETGAVLQEPVYEEVVIVNHHEDEGEIVSRLRHGFDLWDVGEVSGRVLARKDGKWGMLRGRGDVVLPLVYDAIEIDGYYWARHNMYTVCRDGRYGVVNPYGRFYIPMEYPPLRDEGLDYMWDASVFRIEGSAGTGYVRLGDGQCLAAPEWERIDQDRLYLSGDDEPWGYIFIVWKDGLCGLILDDKGLIIPPVWDEIIPRRIRYQDPLSYSVRRGDQWGCCDADGRLICDAVWDETGIFLNGRACVRKDGQWGAIGRDGQLCVPVEWDEIAGFGIENAADAAMARANAGVLLGFARNDGTELSNNLSWVRRNGLWGVIDAEGHVIVEPTLETREGAFADDEEQLSAEDGEPSLEGAAEDRKPSIGEATDDDWLFEKWDIFSED